MKTPKFVTDITRAAHKAGLQAKKYSPEILLVTGVVGVVSAAVMACKATTKLDTVLEQAKNEIDAVNEAGERGHIIVDVNEATGEAVVEEYSKDDHKKDLTIVYFRNGAKIAGLYAIPFAIGVTSIACILASNNIIRKRNIALAAAYNMVDSSFKEYRGRVVERFGKELDRELKYNIQTQEVEEVVVQEDGTESRVKKTVEVVDPNMNSPYARFYDCGCKGWSKDPEANLFFLRQVQNYCNEKLRAQTYLFLNDVYEELGLPKTSIGQLVGWVYDEKNPVGDNFVDFGIYDWNDPKKRDFVNGHERVILLDFNVDGVVYDLI